jgi:hypothetical protein
MSKFEKSVYYKETAEAVRKFTAFSLCQDEVILSLNSQFSWNFLLELCEDNTIWQYKQSIRGHRIDYTEARLLGFSYDFPMILA